MVNIRKIICVLMSAFIVLSFGACGKTNSNEAYFQNDINTSTVQTIEDDKMNHSYCYNEFWSIKAEDEISRIKPEHITAFSGEIYGFINSPEGKIYKGNNLIYETAYIINSIYVGSDGIWCICEKIEKGTSTYHLFNISLSGELISNKELNLENKQNLYKNIICDENFIFIIDEMKSEIVALNKNGNMEFSIKIDTPNGRYFAKDNNDNCYLIAHGDGNMRGEGTTDVFSINTNQKVLEKILSFPEGIIVNGINKDFLFLNDSSGLYSIDFDGGKSILLKWDSNGLVRCGINGMSPLGECSFVYKDNDEIFILSPASETLAEEAKEKVELKLAVINPDMSYMSNLVSGFNSQNDKYYITMVDYSESGTLSLNDYINRLNMAVTSGDGPDMINFAPERPYGYTVYPGTYIGKDLLADIGALLDGEGRVSSDDIVLKQALGEDGKIYFITGEFAVDTLLAKEETFGNTYSWTIEQYLAIEAELPDNIPTIYNFTNDQFIWNLIMPYIYQSINWESGTCELTLLPELLEESKKIRETPENPDISVGENPYSLVGRDEQITAGIDLKKITGIKSAEADALCSLTPIGFPTVDGSCGSKAYIRTAVGILKNNSATEGCIEFIEYMLMNPNDEFIPVYEPLLCRLADQTVDKDDLLSWGKHPYTYDDTDFNEILDFIKEIKKINLEDPVLHELVERELDPFYNGQINSEEAAARITSKVSIYVAERAN